MTIKSLNRSVRLLSEVVVSEELLWSLKGTLGLVVGVALLLRLLELYSAEVDVFHRVVWAQSLGPLDAF